MARILIGYSACQLTRAAFEAHGHEVWTCDLLPARVEAANENGGQLRHYQCDVWDVLGMNWDMAVLHPMCTYMNIASAWALKDPDFDRYPGVGYHQKIKPGTLVGAERRAAQAADIENFKRLLALPYPVAIENPAPSSLNTAVRAPDQVVHPFQFGDDASKGTGFWLTRGLPPLVIDPAAYCLPRMVCGCGHTFRSEQEDKYGCPNCCGEKKALPRWANQTDSGQNRLSPGESRWLDRSKTYPGIAAAMGDQWGRYMLEARGQRQRQGAELGCCLTTSPGPRRGYTKERNMSTTIRYGYNPDRAGENLLAWCQNARKQLRSRLVKPAQPISEETAAEWGEFYSKLAKIDAMDHRELRQALQAAGLE